MADMGKKVRDIQRSEKVLLTHLNGSRNPTQALTDFKQVCRILPLSSWCVASVSQNTSAFPVRIDPVKAADQGFRWEGVVPVSQFERVAADVQVDAESLALDVQVAFERDTYGNPFLNASVSGNLAFTCQRCLQAVCTPVGVSVGLAILRDPAYAERLGEDADYILMDEAEMVHQAGEESLALLAVLEDELMLTLPLAPRHDSGDPECQPAVVAAPVEEIPVKREDNPFAVLAALKGNRPS